MAMRRGVRRGGEQTKRTALNTRSPARPTGILFPCKFCLLSGSPSPLPRAPLVLSLSPSHVLTLLPSRFTWRAPLLRTPLSPVTSRGKAKRCATHVCTLPPLLLLLLTCTTHIHPLPNPFSHITLRDPPSSRSLYWFRRPYLCPMQGSTRNRCYRYSASRRFYRACAVC